MPAKVWNCQFCKINFYEELMSFIEGLSLYTTSQVHILYKYVASPFCQTILCINFEVKLLSLLVFVVVLLHKCDIVVPVQEDDGGGPGHVALLLCEVNTHWTQFLGVFRERALAIPLLFLGVKSTKDLPIENLLVSIFEDLASVTSCQTSKSPAWKPNLDCDS